MSNQLIGKCKNCNQDYCQNCSENTNWQNFCSTACEKEHEKYVKEEMANQ